MSSAFERLQKIAEEKRKAKLELVASQNLVEQKSATELIKTGSENNTSSQNEPVTKSEPVAKTAPVAEPKPVHFPEPVTEKDTSYQNKTSSDSATGSNRTGLLAQTEPASVLVTGSESEGARGYTSINNHVFDKVLRTLKPLPAVVLIRLIRLSHGFGKTYCKVSIPSLKSACGAGETQIRVALKTLEELGFIKRGETDQASPNVLDRGIYFTILLSPPAKKETGSEKRTGSKTEPFKVKELKDNNKKLSHISVGKSDYQEKGIQPLDEQGRQRALDQLFEFRGEELESFSKWYTPEDWEWIKENLNH